MVIRTKDRRQLWLPLPRNTHTQEAPVKKGDAYPPKYFSAATFGNTPRVFTIECVRREKFDNDGTPTEKPVMYFKGERSGYVLGPTKWDRVADALGEEDSDLWPNRPIELYPDTTFFAGRKVPTISARKPGAPPPSKAKAKKPKPDKSDKPPFNDSIDM
jgi:hypothetical protein